MIVTALDDHSRLAYSELLADERKETAAAFWIRAHDYSASCGITVRRVLTDNGACYRSFAFRDALAGIGAQADPPLPTGDRRQGRTLPPHAARGVGLRPPLRQRRRARSRLHGVATPL